MGWKMGLNIIGYCVFITSCLLASVKIGKNRRIKSILFFLAVLLPISNFSTVNTDVTFIRPFFLATILLLPYFSVNYGVRTTRRFFFFLLFIIIIIVGYLLTPFLSINAKVIDIDASVADTFSIQLSNYKYFSNPMQLIYPVFWFVFIFIFSKVIYRERLQLFFFKALTFAVYPVLFLGFYYINKSVSYAPFEALNRISYMPDIYFSNWGVGFLGLPRMYSFPGEPANIAFFLSIILGPMLQSLYSKDNIIFSSKYYEIFLVTLLVSAIILTQSTTGLLLLGLLFVFSFILNFGFRKTYIKALVFILLIIVILISSLDFTSILRKLTDLSGSGAVRYLVNSHIITIIQDNLFLGIGWGNTRTLAFNLYILSGTGLLGFVVFVMMVGSFLRKSSKEYIPSNIKHLHKGLSSAILSLFFTGFIAISESFFILPFFWVALALLLSCYSLTPKK